jgi:3-methyladenine DNA glycosylase AlkC
MRSRYQLAGRYITFFWDDQIRWAHQIAASTNKENPYNLIINTVSSLKSKYVYKHR